MKDPHDGGVYADCWHIPGGGVKENEDKESALVREVAEETGITLAPDDIELIDDIGTGESVKTLKETDEQVVCKMRFYIYKTVLDKPAHEVMITLHDDLVTYRWTDLHELKDLKLTPPSVELFTRLGYL